MGAVKVLSRAAFVNMPAGTIYAQGDPCLWSFDGLSIKDDTLTTGAMDWFYVDPCGVEADSGWEAIQEMKKMLATGSSVPMDTVIRRDGCPHDTDRVFLVFERDDLLVLRNFIDAALVTAP